MRLTHKPIRAYVPGILLTLALAMPAATTFAGGPAAATVAQAVSKIRIDNFGQVDSSYYRGAQPQGQDYADLAALGVKTVINLTSDDSQANEQAMTEKAGMKYVAIPMTTHVAPTSAQLAEFLSIVNDPASQPVYVHCVGGKHRTGVMTAAYRITHNNWSPDQAFKEMKQFKFGADFLHPEFKSFVYGYPTMLARTAPEPSVVAAKASN